MENVVFHVFHVFHIDLVAGNSHISNGKPEHLPVFQGVPRVPDAAKTGEMEHVEHSRNCAVFHSV